MKKIYLGQLERFGYMMTAIGTTRKEVEKTLLEEYMRSYEKINGADPREEKAYGDDQTYYDVAKDELYITEMTAGTVYWM